MMMAFQKAFLQELFCLWCQFHQLILLSQMNDVLYQNHPTKFVTMWIWKWIYKYWERITRPTRLRSGYFPTRHEAIFFDPKGKKLKNLKFLGEIFEIQSQTINGWTDPTRPGSKLIDPDPSLFEIRLHYNVMAKYLNCWNKLLPLL